VSLDTVTRLAALHSASADEAILLRLAIAEIGAREDPQVVIENALDAFAESIEAALCDGREELVLSLQVAELVAIALKSRKKPGGRPRQSRDQKARRAAVIFYGRKMKAVLLEAGLAPGEAELRAASAAAAFGAAHGDYASPATILKLMKNRGKKVA
jgi:hypothetical protein